MNRHTNIFGISLFLIGLLLGVVPCQNIHAQVAVSSSTHAGSLITLEEVTGGAFYDRFTGARIMPFPGDGDMYTSISRDGRKINLYSYKTGKEVASIVDLLSARGGDQIDRIWSYTIAPSGKKVLLQTEPELIYRRSFKAKTFVYDVATQSVAPLSGKEDKVMIPTFSPDGRMIAFVRDNNIFIKKLDFNSEVAVTTDGKINEIINGSTDWVYEEEFAVTNLLSWSEDAATLAYVSTDESAVKPYTLTYYGDSLYPAMYSYKYPKAGEDNSVVSVRIYDVLTKGTHAIKLPLEKDSYIPRITFTPQEGQLAVVTLNRRQNDLRLFMVNPKTTIAREVLREQDKCYISEQYIHTLVIDAEGFVMQSDRSGYSHLYRFNKQGVMTKQLTSGDYDVTDFYGVDRNGNAYYQAALPNPGERRIYRVSPKGKSTLLAGDKGFNVARFGQDFRWFILEYSTRQMPRTYSVCSGKDGKSVRILMDNSALRTKLASIARPERSFTTLTTPAGHSLRAELIKPLNFDERRQYPLVMIQYSGPESQQVADQFSMGWEEYLAQQGFFVAIVDGRGTGARGSEWRKSTYMSIGVKETEDQIAAAHELGKLPYIDASKIAIWGWSYGGYMVLRSMCCGEGVFAAGIAVAPVTDFAFYDTIYTERYMRTPQENPTGYKSSSVLPIATNLKGKLLLIYGAVDDNVHPQNSMCFSEILIQNNIAFDMAVYPDSDHSIYGGNHRLHLYTKMTNFLKQNLQ